MRRAVVSCVVVCRCASRGRPPPPRPPPAFNPPPAPPPPAQTPTPSGLAVALSPLSSLLSDTDSRSLPGQAQRGSMDERRVWFARPDTVFDVRVARVCPLSVAVGLTVTRTRRRRIGVGLGAAPALRAGRLSSGEPGLGTCPLWAGCALRRPSQQVPLLDNTCF